MRGGGQHGDGEHEEERQARARACMFGDTSLHSRDVQPHTHTHTQTLSSRAGGGRRDCALPSCGGRGGRGGRGLFVRRRGDHPAVH